MMVKLADYDNKYYYPGAGLMKRAIWYCFNHIVFRSPWFHFVSAKCFILRKFGATIGKGVIIKPQINIKYPWHLCLGDNVWIGENVWIDNLCKVSISSNVCLSQGAYLVTGNHDYTDKSFCLKLGRIHIAAGAWVGARAIICPGVNVGGQAVICVASVLTKDAEENGIYQGNPARYVRDRKIEIKNRRKEQKDEKSNFYK